MHPITEIVVGLAAVAVLVVVGVYVHEHVTCFHLPYITSGCVSK